MFASRLQNIMNDIGIVYQAFSLPVMEPLTPARLQKIVQVTLGCLHAAMCACLARTITVATPGAQAKGAAPTKDEDVDLYAAFVVQKSVCHNNYNCIRF